MFWISPADSFASVICHQFQTAFECNSILDLCSGSCGPSSYLNKRINAKMEEVSHIENNENNENKTEKKIVTILTDLYPHCSNWKRLCEKSDTLVII